MSSELGSDSTRVAEDLQAAFNEWNSGQQEPAIQRLKSYAERGEVWADAVVAWFYMQQGIPGFRNAIPHARRADDAGMPWASWHLYNNIIGNLPSAPDLIEPAIELLERSRWGWNGVDLVGNAWNLLANNQPELALRLLRTHVDSPRNPADLERAVDRAREQVQELKSAAAQIHEIAARTEVASSSSAATITKATDDLVTKANQAGVMISNLNSEALNKNFVDEARRVQKESKFAWRVGIGVLAAAAAMAVGPVIAHYLKFGPDFTGPALLAAHAGSTAALGTVAGVLLARSRNRDVAQQRATDLAIAMSTTISVGNEIKDDADRERFQLAMMQLVLQTHIQGPGSAPPENVSANLASLVSAVRPVAATTQTA